MSYVSRMCARLFVPSVVPLLVALVVALIARALSDLPVALGGPPRGRSCPAT